MTSTLTKAQLALSLRDIAQKDVDVQNQRLDTLRKEYSLEHGYRVPLRWETFEGILRNGGPPAPGARCTRAQRAPLGNEQ